MMRGSKLLLAGFLVLAHASCAFSIINCNSSCGHLFNISYPFRLKTDPENCGNKKYELSCESNTPLLYLHSVKLDVQQIDYNNKTIRVKDSNLQKANCLSIPNHRVYQELLDLDQNLFVSKDNFSWSLFFVNCTNPVISWFYVDASPCIYNSSSQHFKSHLYAVFPIQSYHLWALPDSCRIETVAVVNFLRPVEVDEVTYVDIYNRLQYGHELSWICACYYTSRSEYPCTNITTSDFEYYCGSGKGLSIVEDGDNTHHLYTPLEVEDWAYYLRRLCSHLLACVALFRAVLFFCGIPCLTIFLVYKWRRRHLSMYDNIEDFLQSHNNLMPVRYSYSDIRKMTRGFKDKLGEGGFGSVYKGQLRSGRFAAIKMLGNSKANGQDFINEVATIGRIHHINVVTLIGFCVEGSKRALVYDFMPNGSLDKHIFPQEGSMFLSWEKLHEISLGVACGIEYLHRGCDMQILHFDIKPHNILLDENFTPKVSDFGLAKLYSRNNNSIASLTAARGTIGYMAPELFYKNIGRVSYKADAYSFGMLLLEMAGRRKNLNALAENSSQIYFPFWVHDQISVGKPIEISGATDEENRIAKKMIIVGLWCIQMKPSDRPSMNTVVEMLEGDFEVLQLPPRPVLYPEETMTNDKGESSSTSLLKTAELTSSVTNGD